ncbi:hypothetical protein BD324DRAFT_648777 [Kockovaella imperatae]|uniref:Uncharacterized protein n=1 Tax=Kockovaella imperatae TaxID=4999 RepID=A0A1Y1USJ7_9TREE|nr:hypothetical protein BD324DRAFT_648777 [Kockovaella imperatae]ORX40175.1 hypothetical protein BD324DRAFT_648777 [Kockovaella imperatae]
MSVAPSSRTSSTYETVVISLVAFGLIGLGSLSLVIRKKRQRDFLAGVEAGRTMRIPTRSNNARWVQLSNGQMVEMQNNSSIENPKEGFVGRQPEIWDSKLETDDLEEPVDEKTTTLSSSIGLTLRANSVDGWNPMSVVIPDFKLPQPRTLTPNSMSTRTPQQNGTTESDIELNLLLLMPDESTLSNLQDIPPGHDLDMGEKIPPIMIASTRMPVSVTAAGQAQWNRICRDIDKRAPPRVDASRPSEIRYERADGFRR